MAERASPDGEKPRPGGRIPTKGVPATPEEYGKLHELVLQNAPYVFTHPIERYYLCDVDEFTIAKSEWNTSPSTGWRTLKEGVPADYAIHQKRSPVKYHIVADEDYYYIIYHLFFAYNGPKRVLGLVPVEAHDGDLENFHVRIDRGTLDVVDFRLSMHGNFTVSRPDDLGFTDSGNPIVYAAVNSHAIYPAPGTYFRLYGLGNDAAGKGLGTQTVPQPALDSVSWKMDKGGRLASKITGRYTDPRSYAIRNDIDMPWKMPEWLVDAITAVAISILPAIVSVICLYQGVSHLNTAGIACFVAVAQLYVVKLLITVFFELTHAPAGPPTPDPWIGWLLPLQIQ